MNIGNAAQIHRMTTLAKTKIFSLQPGLNNNGLFPFGNTGQKLYLNSYHLVSNKN